MTFNSFEFLLFFIAVSIIYFVLPHRYKWLLLLGVSAYFYLTIVTPKEAFLVLGVVVFNFVAGALISRMQGRRRFLLTTVTILADLGILVFFKYLHFIVLSLFDIVRLFAPSFSTPVFRYYALPKIDIILYGSSRVYQRVAT